ncbi:basic proline-rich protein-like [Molothrus ater]|uniref:basic proline-rich protein-like n=1 Tax=Molothrus ater TaxID=84834 RepID=UPI00174B50AE|nr:basic proline-rich protein-like [Molothrus ater]
MPSASPAGQSERSAGEFKRARAPNGHRLGPAHRRVRGRGPAAATTPHHREVPPRAHRPLPSPGTKPKPARQPKPKRLRTKRERDAAKFGPKPPPVRGSRPPWAPHRWLQPPQWGGLALGSPLGPPKPVVITQRRLCHRGLFNHEVKSLDVRRLLTPGPAGDGPPAPAPRTGEGAQLGGVPGEALRELVAGLASLLGSLGVFAGRDLVGERRRSLVAALRRHHRQGPPDLGVFLAHRTPAQPSVLSPAGNPREDARPGPPGQVLSLGGWEVGDPPAGTPSPLHVGHTLPPRTPSPIFGALREREVSLEFGGWEGVPPWFLGVSQIPVWRGGVLPPPPHPQNPFSWSSAEDEEDETPGELLQTWAGPGGLLPPPSPFWRCPQPPPQQEEEEDEEGARDEGWTPIAPPAFSPDPPPAGPPQTRAPRAPRAPHAPRFWRIETPWDPPAPAGSPWAAPRPPWGCPRTPPSLLWDVARAPPTPPRPSRAPQIWSPEPRKAPPDPPRPLWDPPRPPWDPRPWSPELPAAILDTPRPPRTPQFWNPEPPRALLDAPRPPWDLPDAPRPLWDSPGPTRPPLDPPRSPRTHQLSSAAPPCDPPAAPRPSRDPRPWSPEPPGAPQNMRERCRCCCRCRLCCDTAQRRDRLCQQHAARPCRDAFHRAPPPLCRDPPRCCHQPPKRRRPDWGGGSPSSPPFPRGCGERAALVPRGPGPGAAPVPRGPGPGVVPVLRGPERRWCCGARSGASAGAAGPGTRSGASAAGPGVALVLVLRGPRPGAALVLVLRGPERR